MSIYGVSPKRQLSTLIISMEDLAKLFERDGDNVRAGMVRKEARFLELLKKEMDESYKVFQPFRKRFI